jgi:hypothetical protein
MRESEVQQEFRLRSQTEGALKSLFKVDSELGSMVVNNFKPR